MKIKATWCRRCKRKFRVIQPVFRCEICGEVLDILYDYREIKRALPEDFKKRPIGHWKYYNFFPLSKPLVTLGEGGTPLLYSSQISKIVGARIFFKI